MARNDLNRFHKIVTLAKRPGTNGEGKAAWAAAQRLFWRSEEVRTTLDPFLGIDGHRDEIVDRLEATWDNETNGHRADIFASAIRWSLRGYDSKELKGAWNIFTARYRAGHNDRGVWVDDESIKKLNIFRWLLDDAYRCEYGEAA